MRNWLNWRNTGVEEEDWEAPQGRGPGLASSGSAAEQEPIALLQGVMVGPVGLVWGGKHWSSWLTGSMSTMQKVFKGFSVSCSAPHTPTTLVLRLGEKKPVNRCL